MKSIRIPLFFLFLIGVLVLAGCSSRHYVDIYINEMCNPVTLENDRVIDAFIFFPGDYVVFSNMRNSKSVDLEFPPGMFKVTKINIEAGHRVILKVVAGGPLPSGTIDTITIDGNGCPVTNPKAKVGEGP